MNKNFVVVAVLPSELDEAQSHTLGKLLRGVNCRMESFVIAPSGDLGGCIDELIQKTLHLMEREGRPVLLLHPPLGDVGGWLNTKSAHSPCSARWPRSGIKAKPNRQEGV